MLGQPRRSSAAGTEACLAQQPGNGRTIMLGCLDVWSRGIRIRIRIDKTRARTPPSLLGIDRRIAYANRKYHSDLVGGGVLSVFAGV